MAYHTCRGYIRRLLVEISTHTDLGGEGILDRRTRAYFRLWKKTTDIESWSNFFEKTALLSNLREMEQGEQRSRQSVTVTRRLAAGQSTPSIQRSEISTKLPVNFLVYYLPKSPSFTSKFNSQRLLLSIKARIPVLQSLPCTDPG